MTKQKKLTKADAKAVEAVAPERSAPARLVASIGKLGDQPPLRTLSGAALAGGLVAGNGRLFRAGIRMLFAHEIATLAKNIIKRRVNRTRPHTARSHAQRKVRLGTETAKSETSFPSGHSAGSLAVARALSREYPAQQPAAVAAAVGVAAMQVPRRAHYPTDVAAGLVLGLMSEAASNLFIKLGDRWLRRPKPATPPPPPPRA